MNSSLAILVVSFNTRDKTLVCSTQLLKNTDCDHHIFVVDNRSHSGTADIRASWDHLNQKWAENHQTHAPFRNKS